MGNAIDTTSYISSVHNAAPLLPREKDLQKTKQKNSEKIKNHKSFLESILDLNSEKIQEPDYELQLEGLNPEQRKQAVKDIISVLQDKVYSCGADLAENVNEDTINKYKRAVRSFVNFAVNHSIDVKSVITCNLDQMKKNNYFVVKVIDEKIENLTKELLFNQLDKLKILAKLDEIKGLLIDLST